MREPEIAPRPLLALLAALLALPLVLRAGWPIIVSGAFVAEFLSDGRMPLLSRITAAPVVGPLSVAGVTADLYSGIECPPAGAGGWQNRACSLVLAHGLASQGKDDPRLRRAARLLARAGFAVAVPTIDGLTRMRLGADDVETVVATVAAMPPPVSLVGVSVGAGPALLAAADARVRDRVILVVSLGGYASAYELARFYVTGRPETARLFAEANPDLMDETARAALARGDLEGLSPDLRRWLASLSPEGAVGRIRGRLLIVHGRDDPAVPVSESLRLAGAARALRPRVAIVGGIAHVEGHPGRRVRDLLTLWAVAHELVAGP